MNLRLTLLCLAITASARAEVRVAGVFSDHMVLQRGRIVPVWGWADPGEKVTVTFSGQSATAVADKDGKWLTQLPPLTASATPAEFRVTGSNTAKLTDVLVGDVWLGSGQSNMEFAMRDVLNAPQEIATATRPEIRLFTVSRFEKAQIVEDVKARWQACTPENVTAFSAVLYMFGREIQPVAGVPVGLIHSSVGGTRIELWTAPEGLATVPELAEGVARIRDAERIYQERLPAQLPVVEDWIVRARAALASGTRVPVAPDWPQYPNPNVASLYHGMIYPDYFRSRKMPFLR